MTTNTIIHCLEEAAELGERFPEMYEFDVLDHVSEVCKLSAPINPEWAIARSVMRAYDEASVREGIKTAKMWKIIKQDFVYDPNKLYQL